MNGSDPPSPDGGGRPASRRRRWLRRGLWIVGTPVALLVVLHSPPAKRLVASALTRALGAAVGGEARITRLDYRVWAGEASVEGVEIRAPRLELTCRRAEVKVTTRLLLSARLDAPRVVVTQGPEEDAPDATPGPSQPWTVLGRFEAVDLRGGAVEVRRHDAVPWLRLEGIEAQVARDPEGPRGSARVGDAAVGWPGVGILLEGLGADAEIQLEVATGTLHVLRGRLTSDEASLEGDGRLGQLSPILASAEGHGRIDAGLARRVAPDLELTGRLDARVAFEKDTAGVRGTLSVEARDLEAYGVGPWSGSVEASLDDRLLRIDSARLDGYGGQAQARGSLPLGDGPAEIEFRAAGLDLKALVAPFVDSPLPLASTADAELRLEMRDWDVDTLRGRGRVALQPTAERGWPLAGPVEVGLAERRVTFSTADLRVRAARAAAEGSFSFGKDLDLRYAVHLPGLDDAAALLADAEVELPGLALAGAVGVDGEVAGRLPEWSATVRIASEGVSVEGVDVGIAGALAVSPAGVEIESFEAAGVDGRLSARGFVPLQAEGEWAVDGEIPELRLTDALARRGVPVPAVASGRVSVAGTRDDPNARFALDAHADPVSRDPRIAGEAPSRSPGGAPETAGGPDVPGVEPEIPRAPSSDSRLATTEDEPRETPLPAREGATLHLAGSASRRGVAVEELTVVAGGGTLEVSGAWVPDDGTLEGRVRAEGLQLARLPWLPGPTAVTGPLDATVSGDLEVSGRTDAPEGRLGVRLAAIRFRDAVFRDMTLEAEMTGAGARLAGRLGEEPLLSGRLAFGEGWPLHLDLDLAVLPLTRLVQSLPGAAAEERSLTLAGRASLDLLLRAPDQLRYDARVTALEMDLGGTGSSAGPFEVSGNRDVLALRGFDLRSGESRLVADGELGLASDASSPLVVRGDLPLSEVALFLPDAELEGEATVDVALAGRLAEPQLTGSLRLEGGSGRVGPVALDGLGLEATAREGVLAVRRAEVEVAGGRISAQGELPLQPRADGATTLEFRLEGVDPGTFLALDPGEPRLAAPLDMTGRLHATAPALEAIEAEGTITAWSVDAGTETLRLEKPAGWRFGEGGLVLDDLRLSGTAGHLGVDGSWTPGGAVQLHLSGEADLAFLNPVLGGELRLSGPGRVDLTVRRSDQGLALEGGASLEGARAALREPPIVVSDLNGSLQARGADLVVEARGAVADGTLRVGGTVGLRPSGPEVDVTLEAERVPLVYPEGLRSRSSGRMRLSGREGRFRVEGDVTVHRALYDRETDFENQTLDQAGAELKALEERGSLLERVQLDVRVRLEDGLRIQNRELRVVADGAVTVGGDLLNPELRGSVSLRDGGTVRLSRATLRLTDGRIDLAGFPATLPEVEISGRTQVTGIQIDVELSGPLDDLRTSLSSPNRSDLTQADLATLLLTGRTAQAAANESGAIVAEEVAAALGSALNERFGGAVFIDVSRDESLIVQDTDPTQRFNIGIPLGERLYVVYSQALDRSGVRWILDFRPQGQFRVRLISDEIESNAVEVSHGFEFDLWSRGRGDRPKPPEPPRVREVHVEGLDEAQAAELLKEGKLDPGDRYDFFEGEESARRMEDHLVDQGYRAAQVEPSEKPGGEGRVDVVFRVDRGPRIAVEWGGDDPGRELRERFGATWDTFLPLEETASRRARELLYELRARRYYQAVVSAAVERSDDVAMIRFDVRRGSRGGEVDLEFEGNATLPAASLAAVLPPPDTADFFALIGPTGRTRLVTALRTAGARAGRLSLEVGEPREAYDPLTGRLRVTLPVEEGELSDVVRLDLPEEALAIDGASPPRTALKVGEPFRIDAYVDDRSALASWFRAEGFPDARLAGILEPVPGGLAVRFEADTGARARVGTVRRSRDGQTRSSVIDGTVTLEPGDLIRPEDVALSRDHLSETRIFRSVDIRAEPTDDPGVRDLVVDLVERPDLKVEYKVRYETGKSRETPDEGSTEESRGFQFGAGIEAANPFGWAHRYSVYGLAGKRRQLFGATFEAQTFFGRRWRTQVFLFDDNQKDYDTTTLTRRIRGVAFQQTKRWRSGLSGRRWHDRLRLQWGYNFRRVSYLDPATGGDLAGDRAGVVSSLIGDTRDSVTDPHRGLFWTATAEPNLQALGSEKDFVRLYGQIFAYVPLGAKVVWAQGLRVGVVPGEDLLLLLDRRFKAGGATSVRGFAENELGPQFRGFPVGGQALFVFNQELRFPLPLWDRLYGGVFYDAGNVWELFRELDLGDLRSNVGAGVRVMFPFGPVRLDWAWVLDPREGEKRSRWQFALGHAF